MSETDWKDYYKYKYLKAEKIVMDITITYVRSTSDLDTDEMTKFIENIRNDASLSHYIYIAEPNEEIKK